MCPKISSIANIVSVDGLTNNTKQHLIFRVYSLENCVAVCVEVHYSYYTHLAFL